MARLPFLSIATDAVLADTTHMSTEEFGAYMRILLVMWRHGAKLPDVPHELARIAGVTPERWQEIAPSVRRPLKVKHGTLTQKRLTAAFRRALKISKVNKKKAKKRWSSGNAPADAVASTAAVPTITKATTTDKERGEGGAISQEAFWLAEQFLVAIGVDPKNPELAGMVGVPYQAAIWLQRKYDPALILATAADVVGRSGLKPLSYLTKAIETAHERQAPTKGSVYVEKTARPAQGSPITTAIDDLLKEVRRRDVGDDG